MLSRNLVPPAGGRASPGLVEGILIMLFLMGKTAGLVEVINSANTLPVFCTKGW